MFHHKKIVAMVILTILAVAYMMPVFVSAETAAATEPPYECWPQDLCQKQVFQEQTKANWAQTPDSKQKCPAKWDGKDLGYCYTPPASVNLQIPIGSLKGASTLTQYIPAIYNYLVSIVSIIAIIMIMVGGLRYLTAGGNPSAVSSAKQTITGAVIGLFLTFGSYILLQTINPALVKLKMPDIKMVRTATLQTDKECPPDSRQKTGKVVFSNCSNDCDCWKGATCEEVGGATAEITAVYKTVVAGAVAGAGVGAIGVGTVATAARYVIKGSAAALKILAKTLGKYVLFNPIDTATGVGGYLVLSSLGGSGPEEKSVSNGVCVELANKSLMAGELCAFNSNCISGKCLSITTHEELKEEKLGSIGACKGDQKAYTGDLQCTSSAFCRDNVGPTGKIECIGGYCSWGYKNQTCCETAKIDGVPIFCDKGENTKESKCESGTTCGFSYNGEFYMMNGQFISQPNNSELINAAKTAHVNSAGKCIEDTAKWATDS